MSALRCITCPPPEECIFPADLELYGLQGPFGPWRWLPVDEFRDIWVVCPPGYYCPPGSTGRRERVFGYQIPLLNPPTSSPLPMRLRCCLGDVLGYIPTGATQEQILNIVRRMFDECVRQQAYCIRAAKLSPALQGYPSPGSRPRPKTLHLLDLNETLACLGAPYSGSIPVKFAPPPGNFPPFTIDLVSGALPPGLNDYENAQGTVYIIGGRPTQVGQYTFRVRAQDSEPGNQNDTREYTMTVWGVLNYTPDDQGRLRLPAADACQNYDLTLQRFGGDGAVTFRKVEHPFFPSGWIQVSDFGRIYGVPTQGDAGHDFPFFVEMKDENNHKCTMLFILGVNNFTCPGVPIAPDGTIAEDYIYQWPSSFGTPPMKFSWSGGGTVPPGLNITETGFLIGTPTTPGTYVFGLHIRDQNNCLCESTQTVEIEGAHFLNAPPNGTRCTDYGSHQMQALPSGMEFSGTLPAGLSIDTNGLITGMPMQEGALSASITATLPSDPSITVTQVFPITIANDGSNCPQSMDDVGTWAVISTSLGVGPPATFSADPVDGVFTVSVHKPTGNAGTCERQYRCSLNRCAGVAVYQVSMSYAWTFNRGSDATSTYRISLNAFGGAALVETGSSGGGSAGPQASPNVPTGSNCAISASGHEINLLVRILSLGAATDDVDLSVTVSITPANPPAP